LVEPALKAAEILKEKDKIDTKVVDMHTIKPLDEKLVIKSARDTNGIITAEEHSIIGGLGGAVAETLSEKGIGTSFKRMGIKDMFCESGEPVDLLEKYKLNEKHIMHNVKKMLKTNKK
jgi:transketolase